MSFLWIGSLTAVLLPVPLSFFVAPAAGVSPDPWRVRRARIALVGFAGAVAVTQTAYFFFARGLSRTNVAPPAWGVLLWVPMVWFLLASLVIELRRPGVTPLSDHSRRSASLRPRHRLAPKDLRPWWCLGAIWVPIAGWVVLQAPAPLGGSVLLASCALLLLFGPYLVRRNAVAAEEPLVAGKDEPLRQVYATRRRLRSRAIFVIHTVAITWQTLAAAMIGWEYDLSAVLLVLKVGVAIMALALVASGVLELWLRRRIQAAQTRADSAA